MLDDDRPPKVEAAVAPFSPYKTSKCVFIVRWSSKSNLPIGAQVTISKAQHNHERPLGNGQVRPPQQDGLAVVTLDWLYEGVDAFVGELLDHRTNSDAISCIRIGPGYNLQGVGRSSVTTDPNHPPNIMAGPPSFEGEQP